MTNQSFVRKFRFSLSGQVVFPCLILCFILSLVPHVTAAPDGEEIDDQLRILDFRHDIEVAEIVKPLRELTAKYKAALEQQRADFQAAGDLEGVLAASRDITAIKSGMAGNKSHESDPAEVVRLREIYLREKQSLQDRLREPLTRAQRHHAARLDELTATLTQAGNFEEALRVRNLADEFKAKVAAQRVEILTAGRSEVPEDMVLIEGGTLEMSMGKRTVDTFQIGRHEVTWGEWQAVRAEAAARGYDIGSIGAGCADDHPVHSVSWYDVVKWCNLKSEIEGLTPVYTLSGNVYRSGQSIPEQDLSANGYRLPLEAE